MKSVSATLTNYINTLRTAPDAVTCFVECFTFTLVQTGTILNWTNADFPVTWNGTTYSATGPLVQGLKLKQSVGLEVDKQQIIIAARATDLISGAQALQTIAQGAFDGAIVQRHRVFLTSPGGSVVDGVSNLFHGRVSGVDFVGRSRAQLTVSSDLVILDYNMPRNLWQSTCNHTLYDSGCGVVQGTYSTTGTAGSGSTASIINSSVALAGHAQGQITFTSGVNANLTGTIKSVIAGTSLTLLYPFPSTPAVGDAFTVAYGCDHTPNTCKSRFNNISNFRGFPYVPPPQIAY